MDLQLLSHSVFRSQRKPYNLFGISVSVCPSGLSRCLFDVRFKRGMDARHQMAKMFQKVIDKRKNNINRDFPTFLDRLLMRRETDDTDRDVRDMVQSDEWLVDQFSFSLSLSPLSLSLSFFFFFLFYFLSFMLSFLFILHCLFSSSMCEAHRGNTLSASRNQKNLIERRINIVDKSTNPVWS